MEAHAFCPHCGFENVFLDDRKWPIYVERFARRLQWKAWWLWLTAPVRYLWREFYYWSIGD